MWENVGKGVPGKKSIFAPGLMERIYLAIHRYNFRRRLQNQVCFANHYVISVGNLSAGGTGKTPAVILIANALSKKIVRRKMPPPLIVLRGYGGSLSSRGGLLRDGDRTSPLLMNAREAGDEAILLAGRTDARIAIGRNRAEVIRRFGGNSPVVILDDAFQNPSIHHDHDLVLIDVSRPVEECHLFPTGRFREGPESLSRADSVIFTRVDQVPDYRVREWRRIVERYAPAVPIFESSHHVEGIEPPLSLDSPVGAFCGIGNPEAFRLSVVRLGYSIAEWKVFPDHKKPGGRYVGQMFDGSHLHWITTEKDLARWHGDVAFTDRIQKRVHTMRIALKLKGGETPLMDRIIPDSLWKRFSGRVL